jgi:hypothetical protein
MDLDARGDRSPDTHKVSPDKTVKNASQKTSEAIMDHRHLAMSHGARAPPLIIALAAKLPLLDLPA